MVKTIGLLLALLLVLIAAGCQTNNETGALTMTDALNLPGEDSTITLPEPQYESDFSLEQSLLERRSTRDYSGDALTLGEVSQLLWAAQGITDMSGYRTAPSAGALYPLEIYIIVGDVVDLPAGIYHYLPESHGLELLTGGDVRASLADAALSQSWVRDGAISMVITAVYERTTVKYGERGIRYVHIEVGHAAQNICLQATAMGLGLVTVGAFDDDAVAELLDLTDDESPLYVIPVGRKM
jgi:SagB-type dehydrogenase family enzyme